MLLISALCAACAVQPVEEPSAEAPVDHSTMDHGPIGHSELKSSPGAEEAPIDLQFIDTMIVHHQGAIEMAKLAPGRAEDREVLLFAEGIIDIQEREIAAMTRWREAWFRDAPKAINMEFPGMREGMAEMDMKRLEALKGREFEKEFARQMIPHHQGAVKMSDALLGNGDPNLATKRDELIRLANSIIRTQSEEIEMMAKFGYR